VSRSQLGTDHTVVAGDTASGVHAPGAPAITGPQLPKAPARRSRPLWLVGALLVAAGIAAAVVVAGRGDGPIAAGPTPVAQPVTQPIAHAPPDQAPAAPPEPHAPHATPDAGAATAAAPAPPLAPTVTLRFAVEPAGAAITVDGVRVDGAELAVPRDEAVHALRITAPGHVAHDESIRFDESQRLTVQLKLTGAPPRPGDRHKPKTTDRIIDSESPY